MYMSVFGIITFVCLAASITTYLIVDPVHPVSDTVRRFFTASLGLWVIGFGMWFLRMVVKGERYTDQVYAPRDDLDPIGIFHQKSHEITNWVDWPSWIYAMPFWLSAASGLVALIALVHVWNKRRKAKWDMKYKTGAFV